MRGARLAGVLGVLLGALASQLNAQGWRQDVSGIGTTARVLIVGARPEDEDNALIAWLRLGRHVETGYLSLTRGEGGENVRGEERGAPLAIVRTAELLAERQLDRGRQFFTRAYDFGFTEHDSLVDRAWPGDSLLRDVVAVVRAFRPHVVISLFDSTAEDAVHRRAARLAVQAYTFAADSVRITPASLGRIPVWAAARFLTAVAPGAAGERRDFSINVGAFDRERGASYAEIGADIRRLQRTTAPPPSPGPGVVERWLRVDSARAPGSASLFAGVDTAFSRFRSTVSPDMRAPFDSLEREIVDAAAAAARPDAELAPRLARIADRATRLRREIECRDESTVPTCAGALGDLAVALGTVRERAVRAMMGASGLVVDGTVARQYVAVGDTVGVEVVAYNGGDATVTIERIAVTSASAMAVLQRDQVLLPSDSALHRRGVVRVPRETNHWWQVNGLVDNTFMHAIRATSRTGAIGPLIMGEDRIASSTVEATVAVGGVSVPIVVRPLAERRGGSGRGDPQRPLLGLPQTSIVLDRFSEFVRAGVPWPRLFRVVVSSARALPDTVRVSLTLPAGLVADSLRRVVTLPPFGRRTIFFRLQGSLPTGAHKIVATALSISNLMGDSARPVFRPEPVGEVRLGAVTRDYPHVPTLKFVRLAETRLEGVDVRIPRELNVAYLRGGEDLRPVFTQLQVRNQVLDPALLPMVDLSGFSTVLVGAGALTSETATGATAALQRFVRAGGRAVILSDGDDPGVRELLPFPLRFDSAARPAVDPEAPVIMSSAPGSLITRPNVITPDDFAGWNGERARRVVVSADPRYETLASVRVREGAPLRPVVLAARIGRGAIIHTSLSFAAQLEDARGGAARLFINLLAPSGTGVAR